MLRRQDLMAWALDEYKATGRSAPEIAEMSALFDVHITECIKQCILGSPIAQAHEAICVKCDSLGAPLPAPLPPALVAVAKRAPATQPKK